MARKGKTKTGKKRKNAKTKQLQKLKTDRPKEVAEQVTPPKTPPVLDVTKLENRMPVYLHPNKPSIVDLGWYCSPRSILFTPEGQLWVSDPSRYRILRYEYNEKKTYTRITDLHTNCKCLSLKSVDKRTVMGIARRKYQDGFITFTLPEASIRISWQKENTTRTDTTSSMKNTLVDKNNSKKQKTLKKGKSKGKEGKKTDVVELRFQLEIEEKPQYFIRSDQILDFASDQGILFVIYHPEYKLESFQMRTMLKIQTRVQSRSEQTIQFTTSGGIEALKDKVYLLASNPARLLLFTVSRKASCDVDIVHLTHMITIGQFHLSSPFGLTIDWLGNVLVSDRHQQCIYVYNSSGLYIDQIGKEILNGRMVPGYMSVSHNGTLAFIDNINNRSFALIPINLLYIYKTDRFLVDRNFWRNKIT